MSLVSNDQYVEMQRNHIAYAEKLKERIANLERDLEMERSIKQAAVARRSELERERERRDKLVAADAIERFGEEVEESEGASFDVRVKARIEADHLRRQADADS